MLTISYFLYKFYYLGRVEYSNFIIQILVWFLELVYSQKKIQFKNLILTIKYSLTFNNNDIICLKIK